MDAKTGLISTLAGTGKSGAPTDGASLAGTPLNGPRSLDIDLLGNLWVATREGNQVLRLDMIPFLYDNRLNMLVRRKWL